MSTTKEDSRRFLHPQTIAGISQLDVRAKVAVEGYLAGMHRSPFFGQSVEFVQHREYVAGDDIRHLDWKVWSKTDRFYIKQFEAETDLRATVVVDVSESMRYGSGPLSKYEYACTAAACLAYMLIRQGDSAGLITFDSTLRRILPPGATDQHVDAFVRTLDASKPDAKTDLHAILKRVAERTPTRGLIVLFSDLLADRGPLVKGLQMLRHRRHDVIIFHILDDDELDFPFTGTTRFEGMEELPELTCDPKSLREGYLAALEEYLTEVRRACGRLGVDYTLLRTGNTLDAVLSKFLHRRSADKSRSGSRG